MRNGSTPPAHGVGSCTVVPFGATGSQYPGFGFGTHCDGPKRPSPRLAAIMASAAAVPASIPRSLNGASGTAPSDALYWDKERRQQRFPGGERDAGRHGRNDVLEDEVGRGRNGSVPR